MPIPMRLLERVKRDDPELTVIDLSRAHPALTADDLQTLMMALEHNTHVNSLVFCESDVYDDGALVLARALPKLPNISSLDLAVNCISDKGASALFEITTLEELDITSNHLSDESLKKLLTNNALQCVFFDEECVDTQLRNSIKQHLTTNLQHTQEQTHQLQQTLNDTIIPQLSASIPQLSATQTKQLYGYITAILNPILLEKHLPTINTDTEHHFSF